MSKGYRVFLVAAFLFVQLLLPVTAKADLTIAPLRVVFKGRERSAVVSLVNIADHVNTYRLGWKLYKMDEQGRYKPVELDLKDPFTVDKMVVFSPRQVVINPEQHQLVRLSLRRPANLPPGEYRGHLTFTRLPPDLNRRRKEEEQKEKPKGQNIKLNVNLSFSIPIIVRNGDDDALKVALSSPRFDMQTEGNKTRPVLKLDLERVSGKFSTYGSIIVNWQKPGQEEKRIGVLNNVVLYPENKKRTVTVTLNGERISGGNLHIIYKGKYESQGTIWDDKIFPVGG